jgi:hypothetical protein
MKKNIWKLIFQKNIEISKIWFVRAAQENRLFSNCWESDIQDGSRKPHI